MRYSSRPLEFAKGKNAIELENEAAVAETLRTIRGAVEMGEFDELIAQQTQFGRRLARKKKAT